VLVQNRGKLDLVPLDHPSGRTTLATGVAVSEVSPDGRFALAVGHDGLATITALAPSSPAPLVTIIGADPDSYGASWISQRWAAIGRADGTARLWHLGGPPWPVADVPATAGDVLSPDESEALVLEGGELALTPDGAGPFPLRALPPDTEWRARFRGDTVILSLRGKAQVWLLRRGGAAPTVLESTTYLDLSDSGGWALVAHDVPENLSHRAAELPYVLVSTEPARLLDAAGPADPWRTACAEYGSPMTRAHWLDLAPGIPYRQICRERRR
jgi:hypothetical protein